MIDKIIGYISLFMAGIWTGKMFYISPGFIIYFYSVLLVFYLFYLYATRKGQDKAKKITYEPIKYEKRG